MNSCLLESFERCGLGMSKSGLGSSLGENPAAFAGLDQEEFDIAAANPETNGSNLLAAAQLAQVAPGEET